MDGAVMVVRVEGERVAQMRKSAKCGRANRAILVRARNGISRGVQQCRKPGILVLPRASRAEAGKVVGI